MKRTTPNNFLVERLNRLFARARQAPFYREKYRHLPERIASLEEYASFPVLEKEELREKSVHLSEEMLTSSLRGHYVFSAGGTTGAPSYVCYTPEELDRGVKAQKRCFEHLDLGPGDAVANCFKAGAFWTGYLVLNRTLESFPCRILPVTANQSVDETLDYLALFRPTVLISVPPVIAALAEAGERRKISLPLRAVLYAGNHLSLAQQEEIRRIWKNPFIGSAGYAAVETGPIGWQCAHCEGTEHHVLEDWCYLEREEDGNALVTVLERFYHPILRARVGDLVEWVDEPCPCGSGSPKFRLLSRSDDLVRLNFDQFQMSEAEAIFREYPELSGISQLVLEPRGKKLRFLFRVELRHSLEEPRKKTLAETLEQALMEKVPLFSQGWEANGVDSLEIRLEPSGGIERLSRTGKIRQVVDLRGAPKKI